MKRRLFLSTIALTATLAAGAQAQQYPAFTLPLPVGQPFMLPGLPFPGAPMPGMMPG